MQTTLKSPVSFSGVGLHTGAPVQMTMYPASAEYGVWFRRTDISLGDTMVPAHWQSVEPPQLCTKIRNTAGVEVSTIEHLMAAIAGCGVHNVLIEINGPEVPILDGSSAAFVDGILARGVRNLDAPIHVIEILEDVEVIDGEAVARLSPCDKFEIDFQISFVDSAIGTQSLCLNMENGTFVRELCDSRTFCRQSDVDVMRANGLALGGSLDNAVVVDGDAVLTPGGLRRANEAVRHKMLDALGDLALAGAPILGKYSGVRAGHAMTNRLLRALFARPDAFRIVACDDIAALRLPGVGVSPADIPAVA